MVSRRNEATLNKCKPARKIATSAETWFVYILRCADGTLYTGITKDVDRRCERHNAGSASRYTRSRLPARVVYREAQASRSFALKREAAIKAVSRQEKESLIRLARGALASRGPGTHEPCARRVVQQRRKAAG
jgi:predicted GIY-YIG superfamily endonuclease